jgi:hypothetical protein
VAGSLWGSALVGVIMAVAIVAGVGLWAAAVMRSVMTTLGPPDTLGDIARAVAEALVAAGLNEPTAGPETVHVTPQVDGYYRCLIDGAGEADSGRFARALEEVLAPMWEPRWMIARRVVTEPPTLPGALRFLAARILGRAGPGVTVRHALPEQLATSQARVAAFERAWGRWVAPGQRAVRATTPAGEAILAAHRGEDPYRVETQQRTLWT